METGILYLSGQLQAMEAKLLNVNRLDRMVGAKTPEDAFRVMVELQYAEYIDDSVKPQDFDRIIERGLIETKELITKGMQNHPGLQFLWRRFDLNNLKRAYKLRFLEGQETIEAFTEDNGFAYFGEISPEILEEAVFKDKIEDSIPQEFIQVMEKAESIYEENQDFRELEFALDRAHFDYLSKIAEKSHSSFLKELFRFIVNSVNYRVLARHILIFEEPITEKVWLPYGDFAFNDIQNLQTYEALYEWTRMHTDFFPVLKAVKNEDSAEEKMIKIEKGIDRLYGFLVQDSAEGQIASLQIPMRYFEKRIQNARLLKFIMFAKFHGLTPDQIYKSLEHL